MTKTLKLGRLLGDLLSPKPKPKRIDVDRKDREAFRRLCAEHATTFVKARDGYIEVAPCAALPSGFVTVHYDWYESLGRLREALADPSLLDADGGFTA